MKRRIKNFVRTNLSFLVSINTYVKFKLRIRKDQIPVFVYQMGKVASSSIYWSLVKHYPGVRVHGHLFTAHHQKIEVRLLHKYFSRGGHIKVISLVREPIQRNISDYFQSLELFTRCEYDSEKFDFDLYRKKFLLYYPHFFPLDWFDDNVKKNFDIDVFQFPFPEKGFDIISSDTIDLLILKCDLENGRKEEIIRDFINCKTFKIINRNVSSNKIYAEDYALFGKKLKLPQFLIDKMKCSKYYNHFYSQEEIRASLEKYSE